MGVILTQAKSELRLRALGSSCHICVENIDGQGEELLSLAKAELQRLESKFSAYKSSSIISRLNHKTGGDEYIALDREARSLFEFADALWHESNHQFDPSTEILQCCYADGRPVKGSKAQLASRLAHVGWSKLELIEKGARLLDDATQINLNSCVRPYTVDSIRRIFLDRGVRSAMISLDDDMATIGKQYDGANWLVGVKYPKSSGVAITRLKLNNRGYSMRGDFERCLTIDNERYGTALSPVDGRPIPGLLCIGVMAETCLAASGAALVAQVKTEQASLKWLDSLGFPWVAIGRDFSCYGLLCPEAN